jgi:hypothetical protein
MKETIHGDKALESMGEAAGEGGGWVGGWERRHLHINCCEQRIKRQAKLLAKERIEIQKRKDSAIAASNAARRA